MFGNGKVFISHTHQDNALCDLLAAALDAWQVGYWMDLNELSAGQELFAYIHKALTDHDIFIRVCTPAAQHSPWMEQEEMLARSLRAPNRSGRRLIIHLILAPGYQLSDAEKRETVIDAAQQPPEVWIPRLRKTLGIPEPGRRLNRRAFLGVGASSLLALGALGGVGYLLLNPPTASGYRPTTHATIIPQASERRVLWTYAIGTEPVFAQSPGLSVDESRVYVSIAPNVLMALGRTDGAWRWQNFSSALPSGQAAPAVAGNTTYILVLQEDALFLLAMNTQDGSVRWSRMLEENPGGNTIFYTAPVVVAGNDLIVQYNGTTAVVDMRTQTMRWQPHHQSIDENVMTVSFDTLVAAPAVQDGMIYAGLLDGNLYAYDLETGAERWAFTQFSFFAPIQSTPVVANGVVYFGRDDGYCYALDAQSGRLRWKQSLGQSAGVSSVTLADGVLYLCAAHGLSNIEPVAPQGDVVFALDAHNGKIRWQTHPSQSVGNRQTPAFALMNQPLYLNGMLYVTGALAPTSQTRQDVLYALNAQDGSVVWNYVVTGQSNTTLTNNDFPSQPVAFGNVVYFISSDGTVYALSAG